MKRKKRLLWYGACGILVALMLGGLAPSFPPPPPESVCPEGPPACTFATIAEAIQAAEPGDIIRLLPGTYKETLTIDKSLRLIAAEEGKVRIQGVQHTLPTLDVLVQGEMSLLLEGITLLAPEIGPNVTDICQDDRGALCADVLNVRGEGTVNLSLVNVEITQGKTSIVTDGINCAIFEGTLNLTLERSRFATNMRGITLWSECGNGGRLEIRETELSGNIVGLGINAGVPHQTWRVSIEESLFAANDVGFSLITPVSIWGTVGPPNLEVLVRDSRFLGNERGIRADVTSRTRLEVRESLIQDNDYGVWFGGFVSFSVSEDVHILLVGSQVRQNRLAGVVIASAGDVEIRSNQIEHNGHGIRIAETSGIISILKNQIVNNEGWGVALDRRECFAELLLLSDPEVERPTIEGEGNVIEENGLGDLCPEDYNWPPDFRIP
jgi:hypothetical protein